MALKSLFLLVFLPLVAGLKWGAAGILGGFLLGALILAMLISRGRRAKLERRNKLEKLLVVSTPPLLPTSNLVSDSAEFHKSASHLQTADPPLSGPAEVEYSPRGRSLKQSSDFGSASRDLSQNGASWLETGARNFSAPTPTSPPPLDRSNRRDEVVTAIRPPLVKKLQWVPPSTYVDVKGRQIPGMVFVSDTALGWGGEPSAICRSLPVEANPADIEELPYFPSFESLSPSQRGVYLDWLARGRRDEFPESLPTGYLFLFFYGIERRTLVDKEVDPAVWFEVFELLRLYGLTRKSRSVASYFGDFLHYTSYASGPDGYADVCQSLLEMQGKRLSETALTLALANSFRRDIPIDWSLAHLVAMNLDESRRSVVTERTGDAFLNMFRHRFEATFPSGLLLKASKRDSTVRYQTGNATLSPQFSNCGRTLEIKVPGVMGLKSQFRGLSSIWNQCIEDLSGYSRAVARLSTAPSVTNLDRLKAHLAMPVELRKDQTHPLAGIFQQALDSCPKSEVIWFVPVSALAGLLTIEERATLTQKQSEDVADLVDSLGYTLAPHPAILNLPLGWSQEVALCLSASGQNITSDLGGLLRLLYLGVLVASADGVVDEAELQVFHRSSAIADDFGKTQIAATQAVLVRDTQVAAKQLQKIAKTVSLLDRPAVFKLLVHIACCDEVLSSDENRMLRKIAKAFQLSDDALDDVLTEDSAFQTVTVARGRSQSGGESIPRPQQTPVSIFSLDMDRIAALTAETAEVVSILSKALAEEHHEEVDSPLSPSAKPFSDSVEDALPEWADNLDHRYHLALLAMLSVAPGQPLDLHMIANSHHLMTDDLVDGINAWSDESLGDFLIEIRDDAQAFLLHELIPKV